MAGFFRSKETDNKRGAAGYTSGIGSAALLSGVSYVTRDAKPTTRHETINISENSKA